VNHTIVETIEIMKYKLESQTGKTCKFLYLGQEVNKQLQKEVRVDKDFISISGLTVLYVNEPFHIMVS
jgi:hypothetical protein